MKPVGAAVRGWVGARLPEKRHLKADLVAGLPGAIASVPDGMASGVLAGVSPIHGLYASLVGPVFGGMQTSTKLMVITTTSASALAAGSALSEVPDADKSAALILLTLLAGAIMIVAAVLRLGRYTRFVSHSVMTGFLTGIAVNIVFGQFPDLAGADAEGSFSAEKAFGVLLHPARIDLPSLMIGVTALLLLIVLARTRLALFGSLIALLVPTVAVVAFGLDSVASVADVGTIPTGLPLPQIPDLGLLSPSLIGGAAAVAAIVLVQGAGVAEAAPNLDGTRSRPNEDFTAQGVGNVASGLFGGMPVGGSVGQTALNTSAGGKTRWAAIFSGLWMAVILAAFSSLVGKVPMPTLAAVLIFAAVGSIRPSRVAAILRSGPSSKIALITTFVATLLLPVTAAVGIGVALSLLLQLNQEAVDLKVVRLVPGPRGTFLETPAPKVLASREIVVLDVYGSLFYAGARTLQVLLPDPGAAEGAEVILRLRGRTTLGATFFSVIGNYADRLSAVGGRLYLSGLSSEVSEYWDDERLASQRIALDMFPATDTIGESTRRAFVDAQKRLVRTLPT
ncbi:SulP family inorganic anion transporter [Rhodococcus jostii]|uniref:Sulfate permease, SulP family n=1 Tax=Rhodococcus jostii TaxID=132919 RepID=A0A1H5BIC6_RHOJO|nr:SulP family inorganic anion transporter [Rhodococcus jostii]SED54126.1 sulfate permease, SulP family [Rhodococcus jostii]